MTDKINGRTPEEIRKWLRQCGENTWCDGPDCPYYEFPECHAYIARDALALINQLQEDKKQLERERDEARNDLDTLNYANTELHSAYEAMKRERDVAVEMAMLLAGTNFAFPCESDELACSEYCEKHCNFSTAQKECWLEYFRRRSAREVE